MDYFYETKTATGQAIRRRSGRQEVEFSDQCRCRRTDRGVLMPGRTRVEGECAMPRAAPGRRRPIVCIIDGVPVTVIGRVALGLELATGGWFHESGIGECSSGGNVLRRRMEERRSLSRSASSDMKCRSAGQRGAAGPNDP
jgi:hypothetical protein